MSQRDGCAGRATGGSSGGKDATRGVSGTGRPAPRRYSGGFGSGGSDRWGSERKGSERSGSEREARDRGGVLGVPNSLALRWRGSAACLRSLLRVDRGSGSLRSLGSGIAERLRTGRPKRSTMGLPLRSSAKLSEPDGSPEREFMRDIVTEPEREFIGASRQCSSSHALNQGEIIMLTSANGQSPGVPPSVAYPTKATVSINP